MINDKKINQHQVKQNFLKLPPKKESIETSPDNAPSDLVELTKGQQKLSTPIHLGAAGAAGLVTGAGGLGGLSSGLMVGGLLGSMGGLIGGFLGQALGGLMGEELNKDFGNNLEQVKTQRSRNSDGRFRTKSGATHVETLRDTYGPNFAAGLPGNMPLQVLRATTGMSLTQLVKNPDKIEEQRPQLSQWEAPKPAPGGRSRNADGTIRQKRGDTKIETLRETYGLDFAAQLPGNWPLALMREATGMSLTKMVKNPAAIQASFPARPAEPSNTERL